MLLGDFCAFLLISAFAYIITLLQMCEYSNVRQCKYNTVALADANKVNLKQRTKYDTLSPKSPKLYIIALV